MIKGDQNIYDVSNAAILRSSPYSTVFNNVPLDILVQNPNDTLENALHKVYETVDLEEGPNAVLDPTTNDRDFNYIFNVITYLPQYLLVRFNMIDNATLTKYQQKIQINTTLTLNSNGVTKTYFMLAIIVAISGNTISGGHYTSLVFDNAVGNQFQYIFYDDSTSQLVNIPITTKIIPQNLYLKIPTDTAYIILYADITQLR